MILFSSSSPFGQPFCSETFRRIPWSTLFVLMLACFYTCYNCHGRIICRSETRNYRKTNSSIDVLFSPDRTTDNAQECGFIHCSCSQFSITRSMVQKFFCPKGRMKMQSEWVVKNVKWMICRITGRKVSEWFLKKNLEVVWKNERHTSSS